MISLKKFLDSDQIDPSLGREFYRGCTCFTAIAAYRSALAAMGNCSLEACPCLGNKIKERLDKLGKKLIDDADFAALRITDTEVRKQLKGWGQGTARHYLQK